MANGRAKIATQSASTSWLNNAIRSIGLSAKNVLQKEYAPNIYEAVSSGVETSKTIVSSLRRNAVSNNRIQNQLSNNKYVKYAQTAYKNALYDLRSGNLNNEDRVKNDFESSLGLGDLDDAFGDDFSFGDDGADVDVNIIGAPVSQDNSAMFALTDQVRKGTEATLKTSQANMNAMIAMNSASMMQIQNLSSQVIGELSAINQNISAMIEFNNTSMNKFIQSSLAFYERMGSRFDNDDSYGGSEKITANQVLNNGNGGISFSTYKDYIKQQFKSVTGEGTLGMLKGILDSDEMIQMAVSNPLGFATEGLIKYMMPKVVTSTIQSAEEAFSSFLPSLLHRIGEWGEEQADDMFGKVKNVIGKIFGLRMERIDKIDVGATIEKGAVPFDGITRHAIVEVITKELREQTSYLRAIAANQGIDVEKARKSANIFSYKTGTYTTEDKITDKILDDIRSSTVNGMMGGSFGKSLRGAAATSGDEDTQKKLNDMIDELAVLLEKNKAGNVLQDTNAFTDKNSRLNTILGQLSGASDLKQVITNVLQDMVKNNPSAANDLARSVLTASSERNKTIKYIQSNPLEYNLYSANLGGMDIDQLILQKMKSTDTGAALKNGETIASLLGNYQTAHPKKDSPLANIGAFFNNTGTSSGQNDGGEAFFKKLINDTKIGIKGVIDGIMSGDSDKALKSIFDSVSNQFKGLWESFDNHFLTPIKQTLFGIKDENGYSREGIFSGVSNSFKDAGHMLVYHITGKGYKASDGTVFADKGDDEETVVGNFKKIAATIGIGLRDKFMGVAGKVKNKFKPKLTKDEDEDEEGIDSLEKRKRRLRNKFRNVYKADSKNEIFYDKNGKLKAAFKKGGEYEIFEKEKESALGFLKRSLKEGFIGWQEAFFGKELSDDEKDHLKETMINELNTRLPSSITGSAVGAGVGMMAGGSLLGWLVGGPIGGAAIGTAIGFASKSEKFQEILFGKKDEDGNRLGGIISKKVQDYFKENKTALAAGGALGAVQGTLGFGIIGKLSGGILGSLVGGPILGSILGMAGGIFVKSHMFQEFLFGDEATGQKGIIASFNSVLKRIRGQDSGDELNDGGKLLGMSALGAGTGALTAAIVGKLGILGASLSPVGVIGGALVGLGLAIRAQKDNFHTWLFGEKDKNGNKIKEGVLGQFKNMMIVNVIHPLKNTALDIFAEAKYNVGFALDSIRLAIEPVSNALIDIGKNLKNTVTGWFNKAAESFKDNIIQPIGELIFRPITKAVSGVTKAMWKVTSSIVMFPFKLLDRVVGIITSPIIAGIKKIGEVIHDKVVKPITTFVKNVTSGIGKAIKGILTWVVKKPLEFIGGVGTYIADKITGVGGENKKKKFIGRILDSSYEQRKARKEQRKVDLFNMRKEARERRIRTKNEQMIAKATGNQLYEDTEENRILAERAGFKINKRIDAVIAKADRGSTNGMDESKVLGAKFENLNEDAKQTNLLARLLKRVDGIFNKLKHKNSTDDDTSDEGFGSDESSNNTKSKQKKEGESSPDSVDENGEPILEGNAKIAKDIHDAGGIGKYVKGKVSDFFGGAKEGYKGSYLESKVSKIKGILGKFKGKHYDDGGELIPGEAVLVGEQGPELMITPKSGGNIIPGGIISDILESINQRRLERERLRENSSFDEKFEAKNGTPVYIQGVNPFIMQNTFAGTSSIGGIGLLSDPNRPQMIDTTVDEVDAIEISKDMARAQTLLPSGGDSGSSGSGASLLALPSTVNGLYEDSTDDKEEKEDALSAATSGALGILSMHSAAEKGYNAEELKEAAEKRKERENIELIGKNTGEQVKSQNAFSDLWSSIFSKKGLITAGLILLSPLIIKVLKGILSLFGSGGSGIPGGGAAKTVAETVVNAAKSEKDVLEKGGLGDGKTLPESINDTVNRFGDAGSVLNPILSFFGLPTFNVPGKDQGNDGAGTMGILNEDGRIDRLSSPFAKAYAKYGAKGIAGIVGIGTKIFTNAKAFGELLKNGSVSEATAKALEKMKGKKFTQIGSDMLIESGTKGMKKGFKNFFGIGKTAANGGDFFFDSPAYMKYAEKAGLNSTDIMASSTDMFAPKTTNTLTFDAVSKSGNRFFIDENGNMVKNTLTYADVSKNGVYVDVDGTADSIFKGSADDVAGTLSKSGNRFFIDESGNIFENTLTFDAVARSNVDDVTKSVIDTPVTNTLTYANVSKSMAKGSADDVVEGVGKAAIKNSDDVTKAIIKGSGDDAVETIAKTAIKDESLLKKVLKYVGEFFEKIAAKFEPIVAKHSTKKIGQGFFKSTLKKITTWLSKHFGKVGAKLSAFLTATAGLAATVVGWVVKEGVWVVLGAIDGISGTRKLFHINKDPDWLMTIISGALGAFNGTTIGTVMDIINGGICAATGFDIYCEIATLIYNLIMGDEKAKELREDREAFETEYYDWAEGETRNQYQTMKKYGLLKNENMTEDQFVKSVRAGDEDAAYMSIQEYNVDKHKSVYDSAVEGVMGAATKLIGWEKDYVKYDDKGNKYTNNHDGTWTINDNPNEKISEDAMNRVNVVKSEEQYQGALERFGDYLGKNAYVGYQKLYEGGQAIGNAAINFGTGVHDFFASKQTGTAFVLPDGSYYDLDGNHYDNRGHIIQGDKKSLDELAQMSSEGLAEMQENFEIQKSTLGQLCTDVGGWWMDTFTGLGESIGNGVRDICNNVSAGAKAAWDNFVQSDIGSTIVNGFNTFTGWLSSGWDTIGGWINDAGTTISEGFNTFQGYLSSGWDTIGGWCNSIGSSISSAFDNVKNALSSAWDTVSNFCKGIGDKAKKGLESFASNWDSGFKSMAGSITGDYDKGFVDYWLDGMNTIFGFAKGTENAPADTAVMVGEEGPELMVTKGGEKIYANSQPLQVVLVGFDKGMQQYFDNITTVTSRGAMLAPAEEKPDFATVGLNDVLTKFKDVGDKIIGVEEDKEDAETETAEWGGNIFNTIKNKATDLFDNAKNGASNLFNTAKDKFTGFFNKVTNDGFIGSNNGSSTDDSSQAWYDPSGNYYRRNGKSYDYYNAIGSKIKSNVPESEVTDKMNAGLLYQQPLSKNTIASDTIAKIQSAINSTWTTAQSTVSAGMNTFTNWLRSNSSTTARATSASTSSTTTAGGLTTRGGSGGRGGSNSGGASGSITIGGSGIKYFSQTDPRWRDLAYGDDGATMADTGCGPTAMAMVASSLTNKNVKPDELAAYAQLSGMRDETGTNSNFITATSNIYGLSNRRINYPTENALRASIGSGPTILLGTNYKGVNPYTSVGHYVVTDGFDHNGMVNIKDPRGVSYNRKYKVSDLIGNTDSLWTYGGYGTGGKAILPKHMKNQKRGGRGPMSARDAWMTVVRAVKDLYAKQGGHYNQSEWITLSLNGKEASCRLDCSGYVSACLYFNGTVDKSRCGGTIHQDHGICMQDTDFTYFIWDGDFSKIHPGDIMANDVHTQIYAGEINGQQMVYSVGDNAQAATPDPTNWWNPSDYKEFWSPDSATCTAVDGYSVTGTGGTATGSSSGSTFDKIMSWFSQFTSKAIDGILTGKWDTNYDFSNGASTSSGGTVGGGTISGSNDEEKIYNYLNTSGFTPAATAGIMGNFQRESGLKSNNVGDDINANKGWTDEEFTRLVDTGGISRNDFMTASWGDWGDAWGYGLMQWTTHDRKGRLYDNAKSRNVSIADLATQLDLAMDEMNEYSDKGVAKGTFIQNLNSKTTPEDAGRYFHDHLERSADTEATLQSGRLAFARQFYNKYANKSGGSGTGQHGAKIKKVALPKSTVKRRGGRGDIASVYSSSISSSINTSKKYISNTSSSDVVTAINYIISYLEAITNNTAGANEKLNALREMGNKVYVGTTNNISNGSTKSTKTIVQSSGENNEISRNMQVAQKIAKG